jgi:hypothetical protein
MEEEDGCYINDHTAVLFIYSLIYFINLFIDKNQRQKIETNETS